MVGETVFQRLRQLSAFSANWVRLAPSTFDESRLAQVYRAGLRERGLMTSGGNLRLAEIVKLLRHHFQGLEALAEYRWLSCMKEGQFGFPGSMLRTIPRSGHPLKHLLLIAVTFENWADFVCSYAASGELEVISESPRVPEQRISKTSQLRSQFADRVRGGEASISAAARFLGISVSTGVRWAKLGGFEYTPRPKVLDREKLVNVRRLLRRGLEKLQISAKLSVSVVSISRLLSSEPELAGAWRSSRHELARKANRARIVAAARVALPKTMTELRKTPGSGFAWLTRHDGEWLAANAQRLVSSDHGRRP